MTVVSNIDNEHKVTSLGMQFVILFYKYYQLLIRYDKLELHAVSPSVDIKFTVLSDSLTILQMKQFHFVTTKKKYRSISPL